MSYESASGKRRFMGSTWLLAGTAAENLVQFLVFSLLARLLPVAQFGLIAFMIVLLDFSRIFVFGGLLQAVIQMKEWDDYVASVCFTANLLYAILFAAILTFAVGPMLEVYYHPGSGILLAVLSLVLITDASGAVHLGKLRREFAFKRLAWRGAIANGIGGAVAVFMALKGFGVWALVAHRLMVSVGLTGTVWAISNWRPRLALSRKVLRSLAPFSVRTTLSEFSVIVGLRATDFAVAIVLGPTAIAFYRVGGRVLEAITKIAVQPLQSAAFAVLSRLHDERAIGRAMERLTGAIAATAFPVFVGSAVASHELIFLIVGAKYAPSAPVMAALSLGAIPMTMVIFVSPALMAAGDAQAVLRSNVLTALLKTAASFVFAFFGPFAAACGSAAAQLGSAPYSLALARARLSVALGAVARQTWPPALASLLMGAVLVGMRMAFLAQLEAIPRLLCLIVAGSICYPLMLICVGPAYVRQLALELAPLLPARLAGLIPARLRR